MFNCETCKQVDRKAQSKSDDKKSGTSDEDEKSNAQGHIVYQYKPRSPGNFVRHGDATVDEDSGYLHLENGSIELSESVADEFYRKLVAKQVFSIELVFRAFKSPPADKSPARILTFSTDTIPTNRNFTLGQRDNWITFRVVRANDGFRELKLAPIKLERLYHLVVSVSNGKITTFVNGKQQTKIHDVGELVLREKQFLVLGNEKVDNRDWDGIIEQFTIRNSSIVESTAKQFYRDATKGN